MGTLGQARWLFVAAIAGGALACGSAPTAPDTSGNPSVANAKQADEKLGQRVRVIGLAENTAISAAVATDDAWVVYLVDIRRWPDEIEGRTIEATGILGKRSDLVVAPGAPDGIAQGTYKAIHVLRESSYLLLDD